MRTTLDIDDDVLAATKELARLESVSAGQIVSRLLRASLTQGAASGEKKGKTGKVVGGFRPLPAGDQVVSNDQVNALRIAEGV